MAEFDIGNKVIEIGTNRRGTIVGVDRPTRAGQTYQVIFLGEFNEENKIITKIKSRFTV